MGSLSLSLFLSRSLSCLMRSDHHQLIHALIHRLQPLAKVSAIICINGGFDAARPIWWWWWWCVPTLTHLLANDSQIYSAYYIFGIIEVLLLDFSPLVFFSAFPLRFWPLFASHKEAPEMLFSFPRTLNKLTHKQTGLVTLLIWSFCLWRNCQYHHYII